MALFGKKTETVSIPTDQVIKLRQQGLSDEQIVSALQKDGFKSHQIFEAMNQADIKGIVAPSAIEDVPEPENQMRAPMPPGPIPSPPYPEQKEEFSSERIQEVAEAIIDEKWNELVVNVNKIIDWKEEVDKQIAAIQSDMRSMKIHFDKINSAISEKIEGYDKTMSDISTDVKALTKVFQKALPGFLENIDKFEKVAKVMKRPSENNEEPEPEFSSKKTKSEEIFGD